MITADELDRRERFYYESFNNLTHMYHKLPTHNEMILYMALILKENPIELSIEILKLEQENKKQEMYTATILPA